MARVKDNSELWKEGVLAIDKNIDALRDDLIDKGWTDEAAIQSALNTEHAGMINELSRNIEGDLSYSYEPGEYADLNELNLPDAVIGPDERANAEGFNDYIDVKMEEPISADVLSNSEPMDVHIPDESAEDLLSEDNSGEYDSSEIQETGDELMDNAKDTKSQGTGDYSEDNSQNDKHGYSL